MPEEAFLKHVTRTDESELKITFEKGEIAAVNGEKFDDKIAAIQKIEEIGAAYAIQIVEHIPAEPHDIKIPTIVTDEETIRIQQYGISNS